MVITMIVMFVLVFINVMLRMIFNTGIDFAEELPRFAFIWMTFIGAIIGMHKHTHLGVDMLVATDVLHLREYCTARDVPYTALEHPIMEIIENRAERSPCSFCANMWRGLLSTWAHDNGFNRLALGHSLDDAVETFFLNLLRAGRARSFQPTAHMTRSNVTMSDVALQKAQHIAEKITGALGGCGIFGVEMFVCGDEVIFNEVSPRPHDTGMVTLISQELSEFALHARAILGLPIPEINLISPSASKAIVVQGKSNQVQFGNLENVLAEPNTNIRPLCYGMRWFIHGREYL